MVLPHVLDVPTLIVELTCNVDCASPYILPIERCMISASFSILPLFISSISVLRCQIGESFVSNKITRWTLFSQSFSRKPSTLDRNQWEEMSV